MVEAETIRIRKILGWTFQDSVMTHLIPEDAVSFGHDQNFEIVAGEENLMVLRVESGQCRGSSQHLHEGVEGNAEVLLPFFAVSLFEFEVFHFARADEHFPSVGGLV